MKDNKLVWYKVLDSKEELLDNRVMTVTAGHTGICLATSWLKYVPSIINAYSMVLERSRSTISYRSLIF